LEYTFLVSETLKYSGVEITMVPYHFLLPILQLISLLLV